METTLDPLFDEPQAHQPIFDAEYLFNWEFCNLESGKEISTFLYPLEKDETVLDTDLQPKRFEWNPYKQCYTNLSIDALSNALELRPVVPWQLLQDFTFQQYLEDHEKDIIVVLRIGFEVCFGSISSIDFKKLEETILLWINHHIYETSFLVDIHDFENNVRRIQTYSTIKTRNVHDNKNARLMWKKLDLH
jgi:hypothetical protein